MLIRRLPSGSDYASVWQAMKDFTATRGDDTPDEIWLVEHAPVFTQGLAGRPEHLLAAHDVPVVRSDRGGQITYHGPGQVVAYVLFDLRRAGYFVKEFVARVEEAVIALLAELGLPDATRKPGAPGVYLPWPRPGAAAEGTPGAGTPAGMPGSSMPGAHTPGAHTPAGPTPGAHTPGAELAKISALGIKVNRGCTYHGVALNVDMDLSPFGWINPCGYAGLRTVDLASAGVRIDPADAASRLARHLERVLSAPARAAA